LLSIALMAMDQRGHYVPRVRAAAVHFIEPVYHAIEWPFRTARTLGNRMRSQASLRGENAVLRDELQRRRAELQRLEALSEENERLRALLGAGVGHGYDYRFAELVQVDLDPFSHHVMIDRGEAHGVVPGQAVIDGNGVMGQVDRVGPHFAGVRLISDPNHALPVQVNRTGLRTVAYGTGDTNRLVLPNVPPQADVRVDDLLITSGLGTRFPYGYPVARVVEVNRDPGETFATVMAEPLALLDRGREVLLVVPGSGPVPDPDALPEGVDALPEAPIAGDAAAAPTDDAAGEGDVADPAAPAAEATSDPASDQPAEVEPAAAEPPEAQSPAAEPPEAEPPEAEPAAAEPIGTGDGPTGDEP
ncbi:MAG: rod shape-determining protein MreC, partial [Xanthomonadales bacterium]|nr:rod shape-determining protein MreC [Xanthomonadales bacterium]